MRKQYKYIDSVNYLIKSLSEKWLLDVTFTKCNMKKPRWIL